MFSYWGFPWFGFGSPEPSAPTSDTDVIMPPIDVGATLAGLGGTLKVDPNCGNSVLYVDEADSPEVKNHPKGEKLKNHPEWQWRDAAASGATSRQIPADFVATARGVIKIPGLCNCIVSCTGGDDYKISCFCGLAHFGQVQSVLGDEDFASGKVSNPKVRPEWGVWVDSRNHYGTAHPVDSEYTIWVND